VKTETQLVPVPSRTVPAQMRSDVSIVVHHRACCAAFAGSKAYAQATAAPCEASQAGRLAQTTRNKAAASHNRLVRTTQPRSSRG